MTETIGEVKVLLGVMQDDVKETKQDVKEIKVQTIKTNGGKQDRLTTLVFQRM